MTLPDRLGFGMFLAPFHRPGEDPTLALDRDLELVQWLDQLGYDEAWIGEHHSAGWETIASPEVFIAAAAQRTRQIKLGTGVISMPYHHPVMVANRVVLLDTETTGLCGGTGTLAFLIGVGWWDGAATFQVEQLLLRAPGDEPEFVWDSDWSGWTAL